MKTILYVLGLIIIVAGCKKSQVPTSRGIIGKWELRLEVGGIAGFNNHYPPGNGNILQLNADSTYIRYKQGGILSQGPFQIIKNGINFGSYAYDGIYFDHNKVGEIIQLQADTLSIGMNYDDGISLSYVRK